MRGPAACRRHLTGRLAGALAVLTLTHPVPAIAADPIVAVTAIVEHAELDAVRDGIRDSLAGAGFVAGQSLEFRYQSADADAARVDAIAEQLAASTADIVVALSAPTALAVVSAISDRPVILSAITDELARQVIAEAPGRNRNVAGLVQTAPVREHLELARKLAPEAPVTIVPINTRDRAVGDLPKIIERTADDLEMPVRLVREGTGDDMVKALRAAAQPGAAVYLPDHAIGADLVARIIAVAAETQMILIGATPEVVAQGAVATVTYDPYTVGRQTGDAIAEILDGRSPRDIAFRPAEATYLVINRAVLEEMALPDAEAMIARAGLVYE